VAVVSAAAELQTRLSRQTQVDKLCVINYSERTHYKVPRNQAISLSESPLRFEFLKSDAQALGRSEPLAWDSVDSEGSSYEHK
jgi:hypothetical protein